MPLEDVLHVWYADMIVSEHPFLQQYFEKLHCPSGLEPLLEILDIIWFVVRTGLTVLTDWMSVLDITRWK